MAEPPMRTIGGGADAPRPRKGIGLRTRITLPLLLPVLGLLVLSALLLGEKLATVTAMQRVGALTELVTDTSALVHEVQRERGLSAGFLASKGRELQADLTAQRARTDVRLAAFETRLGRPEGAEAERSSALSGKLAAARDGLVKLGEIRQQISQLAIGADASFAHYTGVNTRLLDMVAEVAADVDAPDVARSVSVYLSFLQAKELAGQERGVGTAGFATGRFDTARLRRLIQLGDQQELYFRIIAAAEPPAQAAFMRQTVAGTAVEAVAKMRQVAAEGGLEGHMDGVTAADWFNAATVRIDLLKTVEDRMAGDLMSQAADIRATARSGFTTTLVAILVLLGLTAGISIAMIRAVVGPLGGLIRTMQRLAAGDTDLTIGGTNRRDEIGRMANAIEIFRDQAIENRRLTAAQEEQRARAEVEQLAALRGMADSIETETAKALVQVSERTAAMEANAGIMSASSARTGASAQSATSAASQALCNAQTVASAAEQLAASIREISGQVNQSTSVVGRAVTAGDETRATIQQLDSKVAQIGTVADIIREIAVKTNLLALNATIEAARAGQAGKGFAVVASEVKALAMQTARSTEEIARHLAEVRAATLASVEAVGRIGETITEIDAISGSIAAAVEQQGAATAEIARNMTETAQAAEEMTRHIDAVSAEAEQNGRQAAEVRNDAADLATAVGEFKRTVVRVVRTSTVAVDRRLAHRHEADLTARLSVQAQSTVTVRVVDISEQGARLQDGPPLPAGARGTLEVSGVGAPLPFVVRNVDADSLGVLFELNAATAVLFKAAAGRLGLARAA